MLKALTRFQIALGKEKEAARKFTNRHKLHIQKAVSRGDTLKAIAEALGIVRPPHQRGSHP
jgi:DNA-binding NarL/FixJ family response regulator